MAGDLAGEKEETKTNKSFVVNKNPYASNKIKFVANKNPYFKPNSFYADAPLHSFYDAPRASFA